MASLRRGLMDTVKKAAAKAGTRGARALVETTAAAVKSVDKLQAKLGRRPRKDVFTQVPIKAEPRMASKGTGTRSTKGAAGKTRRTATEGTTPEAQPVELREAGHKTMPAAAPKRSKQAKPARKQFKVKRGQKHPHSGR